MNGMSNVRSRAVSEKELVQLQFKCAVKFLEVRPPRAAAAGIRKARNTRGDDITAALAVKKVRYETKITQQRPLT